MGRRLLAFLVETLLVSRQGAAETLTSALCRKHGAQAEAEFWRMGTVWAENLRTPWRDSLPTDASHCARPWVPQRAQTRAAFPENQARNFSCRMYKIAFRGIFRLFNYSFASGTHCLCFLLACRLSEAHSM